MDYISVLHRATAELVRRFQRNPFGFLYERDLQAMLFALLVEEFAGETIALTGGWRNAVEYGDSNTTALCPSSVSTQPPADSTSP